MPTEAEWEAAARAGTTTTYSFGDGAAELSEHGWHSGNSGSKTHDVASLKPNPHGLHDMHGNVWEWVQDGYEASPPGGVDPMVSPTGSYRVLRGGGWRGAPRYLRSAQRGGNGPGDRGYVIGLRLVRVPKYP